MTGTGEMWKIGTQTFEGNDVTKEVFGRFKRMKMNKPESRTKRLLSVEETASYLGISARTIYNRVAPKSKNPFPVRPKRIGKLVRFDISPT